MGGLSARQRFARRTHDETTKRGPPVADRIPRWNTRPSHPAPSEGELDFGQWHKDALSRDSYCMDVDKVEYRIDSSGALRVVGIYELIRWGWQHDQDKIP